MKLTATFLLCFMLASSFGATCSDGCCEDEHAHEEYEWVWQAAEDHHEAETCTPFCGCNCCQTLIEHAALSQPEVKACRPTTTFLSAQPPSLPDYDIWQPPKYWPLPYPELISINHHYSRVLLKTDFKNLKRRFFSETRQQKRSLAALNEYFGNEVSGKKIASKVK